MNCSDDCCAHKDRITLDEHQTARARVPGASRDAALLAAESARLAQALAVIERVRALGDEWERGAGFAAASGYVATTPCAGAAYRIYAALDGEPDDR